MNLNFLWAEFCLLWFELTSPRLIVRYVFDELPHKTYVLVEHLDLFSKIGCNNSDG